MTFSNEKFKCRCTFEQRHIPKTAGFHWDDRLKIWYTHDHGVAARVGDYLDDNAKNELAKKNITILPWTSDLAIAKGETLLDFQKDAAIFALSRNRSYLALDPGLGKTPVAAVITQTLANTISICGVYICPPFLTRNTEAEFNKWTNLAVHRLDVKNNDTYLPGHMNIIADSIIDRPEIFAMIEKFTTYLSDKNISSILFIDEAHRFKNDDAKRTRALFGFGNIQKGIASLFDKVVYLSGTPMPNRPIELYPVLNHSAPETIDYMTKFDYAVKYCAAFQDQWGWNYSGAKNVKELAENVLGKFMLRYKKADVLKQLPPKVEEMVVLNESLPPRLTKLSKEILSTLSPDDLMKGQIQVKLDTDTLHLSTYRKELGIAKAIACADFIKFLLEETDENILVFAIHKEVIKTLTAELEQFHPLVVTGETPMDLRNSYVEMFQKNEGRRLFIGNIQAAGTGFTLTRATRVVFAEFSWVPGDNDQASDRTHRIGQLGTVLVQYLVMENSVDKTVIETVLRKKKITAQL